MINKEIKPDTLISEISNERQSRDLSDNLFYLSGSRDTIVKNRDVLRLIVDEPCLVACQYLYDCNIRTLNSSANQQNIETGAFITIDYESLDENNRKIYDKLVHLGMIEPIQPREPLLPEEWDSLYLGTIKEITQTVFNLKVPMSSQSTVQEVSDKMLKIATMFQKQDLLYGFYTKKEMIKYFLDCFESPILLSNGVFFDEEIFKRIKTGEIPIIQGKHNGLLIGLTDNEKNTYTVELDSVIAILVEYKNLYFDQEEEKYWLDKNLYDIHAEYIGKSSLLRK